MSKSLNHKSPAEFVRQWIAENAFQKLGYVGQLPSLPEAQSKECELTDCNQDQAWKYAAEEKLEAVIIANFFENEEKQETIEQLAGYRNALVPAILVLAPLSDHEEWQHSDFYGLGFKHIAHFPHPDHPLEAFEYNLRSYNHKRLWNNPKYWANPENFGKYWW